MTTRLGRNLRVFAAFSLALLMIGLCVTGSSARTRHRRRKPVPTLTPTATPTEVLRPVVLITGGTGTVDVPTGQSPAVLDSVEIYDVENGQFLPVEKMDSRRDHHDACKLTDGSVLIVGGVDAVLVPTIMFPGPAMPWILKSAEVFSPIDGFGKAIYMADPRDEPTATVLRDGKVLVVGGSTEAAELYDPKTGAFAATGKMEISRYRQTATMLTDGKVLIAGGGDRKAELYNSTTGKFSVTGSMSSDRIYHTATLLTDGRVMIAGGSPYSRNAALDTTELYSPKTGLFKSGPKNEREPRRAYRHAAQIRSGPDRGRAQRQLGGALQSHERWL